MEQLKYADMKPIYEKDSRNGEESCRPVNIFTIISKINENCLFSQLNNFFDTIFSKLQYGFRKVFCVVHCFYDKEMEGVQWGQFS